MTATLTTSELAAGLCRDFVREVAEYGGREFVVTNFHYPNGDLVIFYLEHRDDAWAVTDRGITSSCFAGDGIKLTSARQDFIKSVCNRYGVEFDAPALRKPLTFGRYSLDCLALCETITRVTALHHDRDDRTRSTLEEEVGYLLAKRVAPERQVIHKWSDPRLDQRQSFPVDFRTEGLGEPRHIFQVASRHKSTLVAAVSHFYRSHGVIAPTMSIVSPDIHLGRHEIDRLQRASTEIKFGIEGNEDAIVQFALAKAA